MLELTLLAALLQAPAPASGTAPTAPPAVVALALDTSGSVPAEVLAAARILAEEVLGSLPPGSQVAVFTFDDAARLVQPRTADRERVQAALGSARSAGRFTALYDALYDASRYLMAAPPARRAIVLLTDGRDENSALLLEDGLALLRENGIPVYAVGVGDADQRTLRRIARLTGGDYVGLRGASGHAIAEAIGALDAPQPPATDDDPDQAARPEDGGASASGTRRLLWIVTLVVTLLLAAMTVLAAWILKRPGRRTASPRAASATLVGRVAAPDDVAPTMLLEAKAALHIVRGPGRGREIRLREEMPVSLGRSRINEIVLEDDAISSQHCRVRHEDDGWVLHDLGSTNGTRVNERRVERHLLQAGDLISLGETSLQFVQR